MQDSETTEELAAQIVAHRYFLAALTTMLQPEQKQELAGITQPFVPGSRAAAIASEEFVRILDIALKPSAPSEK